MASPPTRCSRGSGGEPLGNPEAPSATDEQRGWREILAAATVQGAVFGLVKAMVDRGGATGFRKMTGAWPGRSRS